MGIISDIRVRHRPSTTWSGDSSRDRHRVRLEGTIGMRLLNRGGKVIATAFAQSTGGMAALGEFTTTMKVEDTTSGRYAADAAGLRRQPGPGPGPGSDLREVEVLMFPKLTGGCSTGWSPATP